MFGSNCFQLSVCNRVFLDTSDSGIVYWLIAGVVIGILFVITGLLIIGIGYQVGKIYRKYCWDIISIIVAIMSTAIAIYFGDWIKSVFPINLIVLLLPV